MRFTRASQTTERIVPQLRQELAQLKSGARHVYAGAGDRHMQDITAQHIALLENAIDRCKAMREAV
jgi:hypothetical protein